jgi:hypothetical protein
MNVLAEDPTFIRSECEVCGGQSGGRHVGVACVPGAPVSIAWCSECIKRDSAPAFIFEHDFIFIAQGDLSQLNEWARGRVTWYDKKYISFDEFVQTISIDRVREELAAYEAAHGKENQPE